MVLCSYIYLAMRYDLLPLTLQPAEVSSVHWVPIRALLSPALKTYQCCDVADRLTRPGHQISRIVLRAILGQMLFNAVELMPAESLYCSSVPDFLPEVHKSMMKNLRDRIRSWWLGHGYKSNVSRKPLLLWGLTLGITADFLKHISAEDTSGLWAWPTLSPLDIRCIIKAMTYSLRLQSILETNCNSMGTTPIDTASRETEIGGIDSKAYSTSLSQSSNRLRLIAGETPLDDYFGLLRKAVIIALSARLFLGSTFTALVIHKYRRLLGAS